jgi:hypothetical protein
MVEADFTDFDRAPRPIVDWLYCHHCERMMKMMYEGTTIIDGETVSVWRCLCGGAVSVPRSLRRRR